MKSYYRVMLGQKSIFADQFQIAEVLT